MTEPPSANSDVEVGETPGRPGVRGLVEALDVRTHALRGLVVGVVLAVGVFGFFVVLPAIDPSQPARQESVVLYLALAFVVATSATLLVASGLVLRAVAGRVMAYEKWVRRAALTAAVGGVWWAATGTLAVGVEAGTLPGVVESVVLGTLPLPVLLVAVGTWAAVARTGSVARDADTGSEPVASVVEASRSNTGVDHVALRPRLARVGGVVALAGVASLHAAAFLETAVFFGASAPVAFGPFAFGVLALAVGTAALASSLRAATEHLRLPAVAGAAAGVGAGLGVGSVLTGLGVLAPVAGCVCLGVAWLALGVAVAADPGTYPDRPV